MIALLYFPVNTFARLFCRFWGNERQFVKGDKETGENGENTGQLDFAKAEVFREKRACNLEKMLL